MKCNRSIFNDVICKILTDHIKLYAYICTLTSFMVVKITTVIY